MKEKEYIDATNLARIQVAIQVVGNLTVDDDLIKESEKAVVQRCLNSFRSRLEKVIAPETWDEKKSGSLEFPVRSK